MTFNRILITGADGFLGSALVRQAVQAGLSVTATYRSAYPQVPGVDFIPADICDPDSLSKLYDGVECVCHAAGLTPIRSRSEVSGTPYHRVNVLGSEHVVRSACKAGVRKIVFISSVAVYGGIAHGKDENDPCNPEGPYAESKLLAELRLRELCQQEGMNLTIVRLATLYGEEDRGNVARLIHAINRGRFLWIGKGENLKSLLHRDDAARACLAVISDFPSGINVYNVAGPACTMKDIVETIAHASGKSPPTWHVPVSLVLNSIDIMQKLTFSHIDLRTIRGTIQKWLADDYYNADAFYRTFGYRTQVSLEEGIQRAVNWYKAV